MVELGKKIDEISVTLGQNWHMSSHNIAGSTERKLAIESPDVCPMPHELTQTNLLNRISIRKPYRKTTKPSLFYHK